MKIFTTIRDVLSFNNSRLNYLKYKCKMDLNKSDFLTKEENWNIQTKYFLFCHHGEFPRGEVTIDVLNSNLSKKNILKLNDIVDIFIETKNVSKFINVMSKKFNLEYDSKLKYNKNKHLIFLDDNSEELFNNNKFDCFLLKKYSNSTEKDINLFFQ